MTDQPSQEPDTNKPKKRPFGPGLLMVFGFGLLIVAAWCGYDLATKEEWQVEGQTGTIIFNWVGMVAFGLVAVYLFVLAAKRSKGGAGGMPAAPPKLEPPPAESEGRDEAGEPAMQAPTEGDEP